MNATHLVLHTFKYGMEFALLNWQGDEDISDDSEDVDSDARLRVAKQCGLSYTPGDEREDLTILDIRQEKVIDAR